MTATASPIAICETCGCFGAAANIIIDPDIGPQCAACRHASQTEQTLADEIYRHTVLQTLPTLEDLNRWWRLIGNDRPLSRHREALLARTVITNNPLASERLQ